MYPKFFFERFWSGEQRNELFVCMPFHDSLDEKFQKVIDIAARETGFENAKRVKEDWKPNQITDKIFDGIANSKLLLFDLSDDPKAPCEHFRQANLNVLYELGIANAIREPDDILLIREESSSPLPFDISGITVNPHPKNLSVDWLRERLKKALDEQKWYKSKRVRAAVEAIDEIGLKLIYMVGKRPKRYHYFGPQAHPSALDKMAIFRLIDLGILRFASKSHGGGVEFAYRWTPFGCAVMEHFGIKQMSEEEFEKTPEYKIRMESQRKYNEALQKMEGT